MFNLVFGTDLTEYSEALMGPSFLEMPSNVVVYRGAPRAYIECRAIGNPTPTYMWHKKVMDDWVQVRPVFNLRVGL